MAEHLRFWVGNRSPSITENLVYDDESPVDLTSPAATVKFKMRAVGSSTPKVDQAATIVDATAAAGALVQYNWAAADVDTAGEYLLWWEVTITATGFKQDYNEVLVEFAEHAPAGAYMEVEELKSSLEISHTNADLDIKVAIAAASKSLETVFGSRWYTTSDDEVRYYTARQPCRLWPDEIVELTELAVDESGGADYATVWAADVDYMLGPFNAELDGKSYQWVETLGNSSKAFPRYRRAVRLTGKFGWAETPAGVRQACAIVATQVFKRVREAPFGVVNVSLEGEAIRISRFDPQVQTLMAPFNRTVWAV